MPELSAPGPGATRAAVLRDAAWTVGLFLLLGVAGGVLWWALARPPSFVRTETNAVMGQAELAKRIPVDGIFVLIGVLGSAVVGFALMAWRRRDPVLVLLLGLLASIAAGFVALRLGETLGHRDVPALVRQAAVGARVTDSLSVITRWVVVAWPLGFLVAAVSSLLGGASDAPRASYDEPGADDADHADHADGADDAGDHPDRRSGGQSDDTVDAGRS